MLQIYNIIFNARCKRTSGVLVGWLQAISVHNVTLGSARHGLHAHYQFPIGHGPEAQKSHTRSSLSHGKIINYKAQNGEYKGGGFYLFFRNLYTLSA